MNRSEIAAVACRLLAMGMFALAGVTAARTAADFVVNRLGASSVRQVVDTPLEFLSPYGVGILGTAAFVGGAVWFLFAVYYWQRAEKLGRQMVDDDPEPVTATGLTADDVVAAGCRLIGIVLLVYALRTVSWLASEFAFADREEEFFSPGRLRTAIQAALEAALAAWFLLGTQGIVGLIALARRAGTERHESAGDEQAKAEAAGAARERGDGESRKSGPQASASQESEPPAAEQRPESRP